MLKLITHFTCLGLLLSTSLAFAQPDSVWTQIVSGDGSTVLTCATHLPQGGFAVAGYSNNGFTSNDFFVARLSEEGGMLWANNYVFSSAAEEATGITVVNDTIFVVGFGLSNEGQSRNAVKFLGLSLNGDSLWSRSYEPPGQSKARDIIRLSDGTLGVIGFRLNEGDQRSDAWFLKCNTSGDTLWTKSYGAQWTDVGQALKELPDGNILLLCNQRTGYSDPYDFWPITIDPAGTLISEQSFGTVEEEVGYGAWIEDNGAILLAGKHGSLDNLSGYVVSMPPEGEAWVQTYQDQGQVEEFYGILYRQASTICVGNIGPTDSQTHPYMIGINDEGEQVWSWAIGEASGGNSFYGIIQIPTGGGALAYGAYESGGNVKGYVMRIAPPNGVAGVITERAGGAPVEGVFVRAAGQTRHTVTDENGSYALELATGSYDLIAYSQCTDSDTAFNVVIPEEGVASADFQVGMPMTFNGQSSVNIIAFNHLESAGTYYISNGGSGVMNYALWSTCIDPPGNWMLLSPVVGTIPAGETADISVIIQADTTDNGTFAYYGLLTVHTNACPDTVKNIPVLVSVLDADDHPGTAHRFALDAVYPNPFNGEAELKFSLEQTAPVSIKIFDISGREVAGLADDVFSAGSHTIHFSLPDAASGLYFVRLQSQTKSDYRKIVMIK